MKNDTKMIEQKQNKKARKILLAIALILIMNSLIILALPEGPTFLNVTNSTTRSPTSASTVSAIGGNVSILSITGTTVTQSWQGYVGNISGTITLDDSAGFTLFNWSLTNPEGEVYASVSTVDFSSGNVECYNFTNNTAGYYNLTAFETSLGLVSDDADGVNETFTEGSTHDTFFAGTNQISGICPETQLFNESGEQNTYQFQEVLLYEKTQKKVIYTAIIEGDPVLGYDSKYWDFQMLVGEDGHDGDTAVTTYYFYVELE